MFKFTQTIVKNARNTSGNLNLFSLGRIKGYSAAPTLGELKNVDSENVDTENAIKKPSFANNRGRTGNIVAAAFASLSHESSTTGDIKTPFTDQRITNANTVDDLLSISEGAGVSRKHALKVVSVLADWSSSGKVKLADFESDPRFIKLCRVLTKVDQKQSSRVGSHSRSDDLSTIMSVTADDEAAKLVASITLTQMVKVMQTLASKKRRSTMLLRSLAYNISRSTEKLDLKQAADLLYSINALNFHDSNLLERVGNDVLHGLDSKVKKNAVVGSIVTSLGLLKYKDTAGVLDALCGWFINNQEICRPQEIFGLFLTLAILNYEPTNADKLFEKLIPQVNMADTSKPSVWLDLVWSLVLLNRATPEHICTVLSDKFISEITEGETSFSTKMKLLNVNAAATHLIKDYNGPKLNASSDLLKTQINRTKEKEEMVTSVLETLKNLMQSDNYIKSNINTEMGFFIDAECVLDNKCNPVAINKYSPEHTRVAFTVYDYHDMLRGRIEPNGINSFAARLLEAQGYKILQVPYTEYKIRDKLVHRVQYLESKLKILSKS